MIFWYAWCIELSNNSGTDCVGEYIKVNSRSIFLLIFTILSTRWSCLRSWSTCSNFYGRYFPSFLVVSPSEGRSRVRHSCDFLSIWQRISKTVAVFKKLSLEILINNKVPISLTISRPVDVVIVESSNYLPWSLNQFCVFFIKISVNFAEISIDFFGVLWEAVSVEGLVSSNDSESVILVAHSDGVADG